MECFLFAVLNTKSHVDKPSVQSNTHEDDKDVQNWCLAKTLDQSIIGCVKHD